MIVLTIWDGLRPDFVRNDLTPLLCEVAERGVRFDAHRSVFPSETLVNSSSIATGVIQKDTESSPIGFSTADWIG
ncbi:MAG: hypothetical protein CME26_11960 [Gemmatimonadetes bacterium]|nr:hypothetical protein [Gemmatimonadota bacterium]